MRTFTVSCQVGDLAGEQFIELEALVDTGAAYTCVPRNILTELGVEMLERRRFELADDRVVEYEIGQARIRLEDRELIEVVVFVSEDTSPLIGATTLESFGLGVVPVAGQLVPVNALPK
ncbi:MAG: clan AA aspartic protease [Dehalococcoidia bacterium]